MHRLFKYSIVMMVIPGCATPPADHAQKLSAPAIQQNMAVETPRPARNLPHVEILVSENLPAYTDVARELEKVLGQRASVQTLGDNALKNQGMVYSLKSAENIQIISIGLDASIAASKLSSKQLVFCQVFNYRDYDLVSPMHKGISILPSPYQVFRTWRHLSPGISDIGVITGPGFEDEIRLASQAARQFQITLHHETVKSDKEYQFAFKKLGKKVQGYWLLPDNRVLSAASLHEVMNYSIYNSKPTAVFSNELLKLGGLFSINSDPVEVAKLVNLRLEQAQEKDSIPGPELIYADKVKLKINSVMVKNLGLKLPVHLRKFANAP